MPSFYRSFFQKIIHDLQEIKQAFYSHDLEYSDYLVNKFKVMSFLKLSTSKCLILKLDLISRVNGVNVEEQKKILTEIIVYHESRIDSADMIDEISNRHGLTTDEIDGVQFQKLNELLQYSSVSFFGPVNRISVYTELSKKLCIDLFEIADSKSSDIVAIAKIRDLYIPILNHESGNRIKDELIRILDHHQGTKCKDIIIYVTILWFGLEKRLNAIAGYTEGINEPNEIMNKIERDIIQTAFIVDGFFNIAA